MAAVMNDWPVVGVTVCLLDATPLRVVNAIVRNQTSHYCSGWSAVGERRTVIAGRLGYDSSCSMSTGGDDLLTRLKRISELTERLQGLQDEHAESKRLAERIGGEIALARKALERPIKP